MRIGVDARELCGRATGVGRYLRGLLAEWTVDDRARRHEFVLYAPDDIALPLDTRRFATRAISGTGGSFWEQMQLPAVAARDHLDVWFSPAYSAPLRLRLPVVVAIHDLSFVARPEWFRLREGARRRLFSRRSARKARAVITISEFSRHELIERLNVPAEKIHVIPPGVGAGNWGLGIADCGLANPQSLIRDPQSSIRSPQSAMASPRVLYVGSIFNRRHVPDLIRAFAPIVRDRPDASLDLVGDNRTFPHEDIARLITIEGLDRQVHWHRYVADAELRGLYSHARAFAFLSEYEGLGLPPLEALAAGIPPVLVDTVVARESCLDAALYVPAHDIAATTEALKSVLFDDQVRAAILGAAPAALARYDWPRAARQTLDVLEASA
jgi:glycosyltransferase involved in cell wall biosynthesis